MVEYGNGISHGGAGQVAGGSGGTTSGSSLLGNDIGTNVSNFVNGAVHTVATMPLAEQLVLGAVALLLGFWLLRRAF